VVVSDVAIHKIIFVKFQQLSQRAVITTAFDFSRVFKSTLLLWKLGIWYFNTSVRVMID
jgi:hypothetical protein